MFKLETIVFATDFSECADHAKQYACEFATQFHAELHVLHVIPDPSINLPDFGMGLAPVLMDNMAELRKQAEQSAIAELSRQAGSAVNQCRRVVLATRFGAPFSEILDYAREHSADLIVVGTHGRSGVVHMLLGSVAEKVVRKADCPVLTVGPRGKASEPHAAATDARASTGKSL
jgi:nucleotide-binding universal stress UspA family protein